MNIILLKNNCILYMENPNYLINIVLVILISGLILTIIGNYILNKFSQSTTVKLTTCDEELLEQANNSNDNNSRNGYILSFTGYIVTAMGLLFLLILSTFFSMDSRSSQTENIKKIISGNFPVFLSLIIVSYILLLNVKFKQRFLDGKVSNEFFSYLSFFSIMFIIQIITLSKYMKSISAFKNISERQNNQSGTLLYALSFVNILILAVLNIILSFFSTDG